MRRECLLSFRWKIFVNNRITRLRHDISGNDIGILMRILARVVCVQRLLQFNDNFSGRFNCRNEG